MKTLEQLGISPAPWKKADDGMGYKDIWCNAPVTEDSEGENIIAEAIDAKDAHLIAAAPELYEALRMYQKAFAEIRKSAWFLDANFHEIMSLNKVMTAADAALAKAAGESEAE